MLSPWWRRRRMLGALCLPAVAGPPVVAGGRAAASSPSAQESGPALARCGYVDAQGAPVLACCAGQAPGLLMMHRCLGSSDDWWPVAEILPTGYRLVAFDQPGCGRSPAAAAPVSRQVQAVLPAPLR